MANLSSGRRDKPGLELGMLSLRAMGAGGIRCALAEGMPGGRAHSARTTGVRRVVAPAWRGSARPLSVRCRFRPRGTEVLLFVITCAIRRARRSLRCADPSRKMHAIPDDRGSARRRRVLLLVLSRSLSSVRAQAYAPSAGYGTGVSHTPQSVTLQQQLAMNQLSAQWTPMLGPTSTPYTSRGGGTARPYAPSSGYAQQPYASNRQVDLSQTNVLSLTVDHVAQPVNGDRPGCAPRARSSHPRGPGPARRQSGGR